MIVPIKISCTLSFLCFLFILPLSFHYSLLSIYDIRMPELYAQSIEGDNDAETLDVEKLKI